MTNTELIVQTLVERLAIALPDSTLQMYHIHSGIWKINIYNDEYLPHGEVLVSGVRHGGHLYQVTTRHTPTADHTDPIKASVDIALKLNGGN